MYFYTLTIEYQYLKKNKENNLIYNSLKNNKILKNKFNHERSEQWKPQDFDERNWRGHKQIERYPPWWIRRINIVKMFIPPTPSVRSLVAINIPMISFTEIEKNLKICMEQRPQIEKAILIKKNKLGGITCPDCKLYYKAIVIKTLWYWHKNRHINLWNRIESPWISLCIYSQLIFEKGAKNIQWENGVLFNKWYWENCITTWSKIKPDPYDTYKN